MNPIRSIEEVIENWDIFGGRWRSIYAFFLYTNEDKNIARYVREYFHELDRLSGSKCLIFLIDKPPKSWEEEAKAREYWAEFKFRQWVWEGFTEIIPYDRSKAYEIAEFLSISPRFIPCLVFFRNINETELLVYPLDNSWSDEKSTKEFRELFSVVQKSIEDAEDIEKQKELIWDELKTYVRRKNVERKTMQFLMHPLTRSIGDVFKQLLHL